MYFDQPKRSQTAAGPHRPWTWETAEVFKIRGGKIHQVEALLEPVPDGMLSGWSNWEEGLSSEPRTLTGGAL